MAKFTAIGTVVGAVFLFVFGGIMHSAVPLDLQGLYEFQNSATVAEAVRANAARGNGVYFGKEGLLAAVHFEPGVADRTQNIGPLMVKEVFTDLASAFLLCLLVLALKCTGTLQRAGALGIAALAAGMENQVSDWNWYGFSAQFSLFELADIVASWFLLGLILSLLKNKLAPEA